MNWNLNLEEVVKKYKEYANFKPLWYNDWYDGPLDGIGILIDRNGKSVDSKLYYYYIIDDLQEDGQIYQINGFQELTDEERVAEEFWQNLYEMLVGADNREDERYKAGTKTGPAGKFGRALWDALYRKFRKQLSADDSRIVGWYRW